MRSRSFSLLQALMQSGVLAVAVMVVACGGVSGGARSYRVIDSAWPVPDLVRRVGDGTVVSRQLLAEPDLGYAEVSPDGRYYSMLDANIGGGMLHVGKVGSPARPLFGVITSAWVGEHTLIYRRGNTWYRAEAKDDAFSSVDSTKIVQLRSESYSDRDLERTSIWPDRKRVVFMIKNADDDRASPWVYDVTTRALNEIVHNTRYDEIVLDENAQPAFGVLKVDGGLQLFERTAQGWLDRTLDLPSHVHAVLDYRGGTLALERRHGREPRAVLWNPKTREVKDLLPPGATRAILDQSKRSYVAVYEGKRWRATDPRHAAVVEQLNELGVTVVHPVTDRQWVADAARGDNTAFYSIDVDAGVIRELGPHRARGATTREIPVEEVEIPSRKGRGPTVAVYEAVAPVHGVVFWGNQFYDFYVGPKLARLLASRGYHVVTGTNEDALDHIEAEHVAWARARFAQLPIACGNMLHHCAIDDGRNQPAAVIETQRASHWEPRENGIALPPTLLIGAGYPRATSLEQYDDEQQYLRESGTIATRAAAPLSGVALRGARDAYLLAYFALIEGFLAQHLGGRMEPMDGKQLERAGVRVMFGGDKLAFLAGHDQLVYKPLTQAQRAELVAGYASVHERVLDVVHGPCDSVPARMAKVELPASVRAYRYSDEYLVLGVELRHKLANDRSRSCNTISSALDDLFAKP